MHFRKVLSRVVPKWIDSLMESFMDLANNVEVPATVVGANNITVMSDGTQTKAYPCWSFHCQSGKIKDSLEKNTYNIRCI